VSCIAKKRNIYTWGGGGLKNSFDLRADGGTVLKK
jgi:hypothetical protein